jgi:three-Cys-motif partner protein
MTGTDVIGAWSQTKLDMLRQYLAAYTSILRTQRWCQGCHYVDAFAGGVRHLTKDGEGFELIDGSPLLALKNHPPFDSFTFIDMDEERINKHINPLRKDFPEKRITTLTGDCNKKLVEEVLPRFSGKGSPHRGFIFLDPYGINLEWKTVEAIAKTLVYDVLINFSVMGVYRQLGAKPPGDALRKRLNNLMGTEEWHSLVYKPSRMLSLFDDAPMDLERQSGDLPEKLTNFYRKRLSTRFDHVSRPVMMRNSSRGPLYALMLASHVEVAVQKMHEIFDRRERKARPKKR